MAYCFNRKIGYILVIFFIIVSMLTNGILTLVGDVSIRLESDNIDALNLMYNKPWARMGAYFVGAIFGLSYFELANKEKYGELSNTFFNGCYNYLKSSRISSAIMALCGVGLTAIYVFPLRSFYLDCGASGTGKEANCWPLFPSFLYNLTARPFFVLGIGLVLAPTFVGRLRLVKYVLSAEPFVVLARLNYMVYLIHCLVIFWYLNDLRQPSYVTNLNQWFFAIGTVVVSFILSVPFTLICEVPFMNLEKLVLFPYKTKPIKENENVEMNGRSHTKQNGVKYFPMQENDETHNSSRLLD